MIVCNIENVDAYQEAIDSEFEFNGDAGVIRSEGSLIGFYNAVHSDSTEIYLGAIEILDKFKKQGFGKLFIQYLFETYPDVELIYGRATLESVGFYDKIGSYFVNSKDNSIVIMRAKNLLENESADQEDYCVELRDFIISRKNFFFKVNI